MVTSTVRPNEDNSVSWASADPHYAQVNDAVNYPDAGGDSSYVSANKLDANDTEQFGYENPTKVGKIRNITMYVRGRRAGGAGDVQISHYDGAWQSNVNAGLGTSNGWGTPRSV